MKIFLIIITTIFCNYTYSQHSDFILLKKRKKTIHSYFSGTHIEFTTETGAYMDAYIYGIRNDSIFLQEFIVQRIPTTIGTFIIDTVGSYRYKYHYKQIRSIGPKPNRGFNVRGSGAALLGGGTLLTLASGVVWLVDKEKFSPELMLASVGLAGAGYLMSKSGSKGIIIGKKYRIVYMKMSADNK